VTDTYTVHAARAAQVWPAPPGYTLGPDDGRDVLAFAVVELTLSATDGSTGQWSGIKILPVAADAGEPLELVTPGSLLDLFCVLQALGDDDTRPRLYRVEGPA
jgi:hypothetical protein